MCIHLMHGNRETRVLTYNHEEGGPVGEGLCPKTDMHGTRESDSAIVPQKRANGGRLPSRDGGQPEESGEGRALAKGNPQQPTAASTQGPSTESSGLERIRKAAKGDKTLRFTSLLHHIDTTLLAVAYTRLKREAAPGVDGVSWREYGEQLGERLMELNDRLHSGSYRAQPSKRAWIPKADGSKRPLGIAALEDKIVQQALVLVLEKIYEEDFKGFSYGFRPGRNPHQALDAVYVACTQRKVNWILDADIRSFFDTINHDMLMKLLEIRIGDQRVLRLIGKFLRAGVSDDGEWSMTTVGTPQGAVISPLLANVYLHHVLDEWVSQWRKVRARGEVYIVRYADDFVMGFQYRTDAEAMREALRNRLKEHGLELHEGKTRLIEFGRFAESNRQQRGEGKPETFDFLGFTHICAKKRSNGKYTVRRQTIPKRLRRKLDEVKQELSRRYHKKVRETGAWLRSVINGHMRYYSVPGNLWSIQAFKTQIVRYWFETLRRRGGKAKVHNWEKMKWLVARWIPSPKVLHPYPNARLRV